MAELAAAGRTNKEIAAEIHLSVKAVEANLSRVYAKLAVRSRSGLAAQLVGFSALGRSDRTPTSTPLDRPS